MKQLYFNGQIVTMEQEEYQEAVLVEDGVIIEVGKLKQCEKNAEGAEYIDLNMHTLLPAFIDPHSHFSGVASALLQIPLEEAVTIEEIKEKIRTYIAMNELKEGSWIILKGYDHNQLKEKRHITRTELDQVSAGYPVMVQHKSGHIGVFNTKGLEILGITNETKAPEGGKIGIKDGQLTGYMEENAYISYMQKVPMPAQKELFAAYYKAQDVYASHGITTVQEGMIVEQILPLYDYFIQSDMLKLDLVGYSEMKCAKKVMEHFKKKHQYDHHIKIGGYKIFLDGSPQARTAWMQTPYEGEENYYGYETMESEAVCDAIRTAAKADMQILAHCNGDAAAQQYIDCIRKVSEEGYPVKDLRPVMIHAQLLNVSQLKDVKELGIIPSFFVAHIWYWGDTHIENFGLERASKISPAASALKEGIRFTFHQDAPVIEPDMLETVSCAVNRITKNGVLLGADEKISVKEALKAVTIHAAYQYFEEEKKGSIAAGKHADFVLLDKNPMEVPLDKINEIQVLQTIKDGKIIFQK